MARILYCRGAPPASWRRRPTRLFVPAAIAISLSPASSSLASAYVSPINHRLAQLSTLAPTNHRIPRCSILRTCWAEGAHWCRTSSTTSLASSTSESSTHGSTAVRSMKPLPTDSDLQLLSFYRFTPISQPESVRDTLFERLASIEGLRGTAYIAEEGNAQFAVPIGNPLDELLTAFKAEASGGCLPFDAFDNGNNAPNMGSVVDGNTPTFDRLIVRTRDCILRDGMNLDDNQSMDWSDAGVELEPSEWDEQLRQESNIQLLDCRNAYESDEGSFASATPLNTQTFSDTWSVLDSQTSLDPAKPVYIYCTGGIRCVKVGVYLRHQLGFEDVRSLKHGIIGYQRWSKDSEDKESGDDSRDNRRQSLWVGENFLFDKRRFVGEGDDSDNEASTS